MVKESIKGTTVYEPDRCYNGYILLPKHENIKLIDMNGNVVHVWKGDTSKTFPMVPRAQLLKNDNIVRFAGMREHKKFGGYRCPEEKRPCVWLVETDWDGNVVQELMPLKGQSAHHNFQRLDNNHTFVIVFEDIPEEYRARIKDPVRKKLCFDSDAILEFDEKGEIIWEWHAYEHFDINQMGVQDFYPFSYYPDYYKVSKSIIEASGKLGEPPYDDWTHINTVRIIPENKWYDSGDKRFKPGNVLINPRNFNRMYIIDKENKDIVWYYTGNFMGGLAHPHDPYMIPKGFPGAGNILIFDNGIGGTLTDHEGVSAVLEINPITKKVIWNYTAGQSFFSQFQGIAQRLTNGNTFICESNKGRFFQVTPEKEIVWEYFYNKPWATWGGICPYDWCPQLELLPKPKEMAIMPQREQNS